MKRGFFKSSLKIIFILLLTNFFSIDIVAALDYASLDGSVLTINSPNITEGNNYVVVIVPSGDETQFELPKTAVENTTLTVNDDRLEKFNEITIALNMNNTPIIVSLGVIIKKTRPALISPIASPTITAVPTITANATPTTIEPPAKGILGIDPIYFILFGLFIIALVALWSYLKLERREDPEQKLVSPSIATLTNKLQIDLLDESGFIRITDAKVKAVNRRGIPYLARIESDGTYLLELPKGTYKIEVDGGENYESTSKEVNIPSDDEKIKISLIKRQPVQIEVVDEAGKPVSGINVSVKETASLVDANGSPGVTDNLGIAKFTISRNKQYAVSVRSPSGEFVEQMNIPLSSSEIIMRIKLLKKAGTLEMTISEQTTGKPFAGIPVAVMKKGTSQIMDFAADNNGRINKKLPIGDYIIRLKTSNPPLYDPVEKQVTIIENRTSSVTLDFRFNYQPKPEFLNSISKINEKLNTGFKEVSTYDTCIPLYFKKVGEKPTHLVDKIIKRPAEFLGAKTSPDEIIKYTLSIAEVLADEISRIMREKSNVDFYFSIQNQNLSPVDDLTISDYSQEKFTELVRDTENYHKNHFREVGNKLDKIDNELTQLSGTLTIQPVADLWRVAQKLQENSINETDAKKRGAMLFINDKLLDHVREMYNKEEVKARLRFSML